VAEVNWLKEHSFLGTWLGPLVAVILYFAREKLAKVVPNLDNFKLVLYLVFAVSFGVTINSVFDEQARTLARNVCMMAFGAILIRK
jgi:hypothetical protein